MILPYVSQCQPTIFSDPPAVRLRSLERNNPQKLEVIHCVRGVLSPLLANIYLHALDQELERRGLSFCRYADDCNVYVGSQRAAERVLASLTGWIRRELHLEVNATKSGAGRSWERKFLGFRINPQGQIEAAPQSLDRYQQKVRELWRSCQGRSSAELRANWCA